MIGLGILSWSPLCAQDTLTVMSYNIYHGEQPYNEGQNNLQEVADLIKEIQPDFVALQEVDEMTERVAALNQGQPFSLADSLAALTGMHGYFGKAIDYAGGGYGEGLLSKVPLETQKIMLPVPKGGEDRALLFAKVQTSSGHHLIVGGTHLGHQFSENRLAQVVRINDYFSDMDVPILLGGDFNFTPESESYRTMQEQWIDAALLSGVEPGPTISYENPQKRIDYIFLSREFDWEVLDYRTIKVGYSDHMPVVATIVMHAR
ncbi:Metal-dependent hydrolase, endonuclease/exonuclease/phosphatase family [Fodinibius sediminis]|uniref:Metal-dependent hydrolase, endonuclease/exonuclease/phosphatase family n=2 Tax=Fodinibius sediminis TaxID=1214077 RepID=A0A521C4L8_9BACT|nr:Metal-dependent hydrolase, endonuclease/exonuclease/phosphatase family [Fodinibius sediminis]